MEDFTVVIDTREKRPLNFAGQTIVKRSLKTGDYSILGYEDRVSIERKSLADLLQSITSSRKRFNQCVDRLLEFESKALLIEAMPFNLEVGGWRNKIHPNSVVGTIMSYKVRGLPVIYTSTHNHAGKEALRFLRLFYERNCK